MDFAFTKHALEQMEFRNIAFETVQNVLQNPQQIVTEQDYAIYQSIVNFTDGKFLLRIFINDKQEPNKVITFYRTSKIKKYYEG